MKLPSDPDAQEHSEGLRQILSLSFSSATVLLKMCSVVCTLKKEGMVF